MFRWIKRLFCKHPQYICPIVPMMGPAPWKFCADCGHQTTLTAEDYQEGSGVLFEQTGAEIVEMTPGSGR